MPMPDKPSSAPAVWRSGINEARVFGRLGHPTERMPLWRYGEQHWYSPRTPAWALRADPEECKVLARAIAKYGVRDAGRESPRLLSERLVAHAQGGEVELSHEHASEMTLTHSFAGRDHAYSLVVLAADAKRVVVAAPVVYTLRRHKDVAWTLDPFGWLTGWALGDCVAIVATYDRSCLQEIAA